MTIYIHNSLHLAHVLHSLMRAFFILIMILPWLPPIALERDYDIGRVEAEQVSPWPLAYIFIRIFSCVLMRPLRSLFTTRGNGKRFFRLLLLFLWSMVIRLLTLWLFTLIRTTRFIDFLFFNYLVLNNGASSRTLIHFERGVVIQAQFRVRVRATSDCWYRVVINRTWYTFP